MLRFFAQLLFCLLLTAAASVAVSAQVDAENGSPSAAAEKKRDEPKSFSEILAKHRAEQDVKEHEELLQRGDEALKISDEIEFSFDKSKRLSKADRQQLDDLERIVVKIRKELGASGDDSDPDEPGPSDVAGAIRFLQSNAAKLVDELKKTSRFTISAAAIQTSNTLLRVVRFLRSNK